MTRKDTIIVTVLVNAGLLVVLFISALKNEPMPRATATTVASSVQKIEVPKPVVPVAAPKEAPPAPKKVEPAPAPKKLPVKTVSAQSVNVQKGDVLEKIAKKHNVSVEALMKKNHLSDTRLQIGQTLELPEEKVSATSQKVAVDPEYYVVKEGDNPWTIAKRHNIRVSELLKLNDMDDQKAKKIRPGHKLRVK